MRGGGYSYCIDHSVAPTVSLEHYDYVLQLAVSWAHTAESKAIQPPASAPSCF